MVSVNMLENVSVLQLRCNLFLLKQSLTRKLVWRNEVEKKSATLTQWFNKKIEKKFLIFIPHLKTSADEERSAFDRNS